MKTKVSRSGARKLIRYVATIICVTLLAPLNSELFARNVLQQAPAAAPEEAKVPPDQLDALVAPIALYPDPLLSQTLVASTYPLEIVQLQQWLVRNPNLKDKALTDAVAKQTWDPSIQSMAALPDLVKRLSDDIQWTTDLGNAFLSQQSDVMAAVQRMRKKAQGAGSLKSNEQQKVEVRVIESKEVIVVEQSNPQVVYVPSYNPVYVYGPPIYPYPPIYYPPYSGVVAASAISFGVGMAIGAAWGGGGWGYGCGWGNNDININYNNTFNRNTNINGGNRTNVSGGNRNQINGGNRNNVGGGNKWQHNPQHRGGTPYGNKATANKFGGTARGDSLNNRQSGARQQINRQGGNLSSARPSTGYNDRLSGGGGLGDRSNSGGLGDRSSSGGLGDRSSSGGLSNRSSSAGDRVGNRGVSNSSGSRGSSFGGGSGGYSGNSARQSSSRGSSSYGGSRGGGGYSGGGSRGGGGGRGGGGRGGGRR